MTPFSLLAQAKPLGPIQGIGGYDVTNDPTSGFVLEGSSHGGMIELLASNTLGFMTVVAGLAFLIYFAIGGLTWITSGGDKGKVEEAKKRMTGAAIGMIIIVASWSITWIVGKALGLDYILTPSYTINQLRPTTGP